MRIRYVRLRLSSWWTCLWIWMIACFILVGKGVIFFIVWGYWTLQKEYVTWRMCFQRSEEWTESLKRAETKMKLPKMKDPSGLNESDWLAVLLLVVSSRTRPSASSYHLDRSPLDFNPDIWRSLVNKFRTHRKSHWMGGSEVVKPNWPAGKISFFVFRSMFNANSFQEE